MSGKRPSSSVIEHQRSTARTTRSALLWRGACSTGGGEGLPGAGTQCRTSIPPRIWTRCSESGLGDENSPRNTDEIFMTRRYAPDASGRTQTRQRGALPVVNHSQRCGSARNDACSRAEHGTADICRPAHQKWGGPVHEFAMGMTLYRCTDIVSRASFRRNKTRAGDCTFTKMCSAESRHEREAQGEVIRPYRLSRRRRPKQSLMH
jgi:hypothetical protein